MACLGIVVWATSGALHPLMSRYQPAPAPAVRAAPAPVAVPHAAPAPAAVLAAHGIASVHRVRLIGWGARNYYQIVDGAGRVRYFDAATGSERVAYAGPREQRYYVHLDSATLAARVDAFDDLEGWTFAHAHKWQWLAFIGHGPRDLLLIGFALTAAGVGLSGLVLFLRRDPVR